MRTAVYLIINKTDNSFVSRLSPREYVIDWWKGMKFATREGAESLGIADYEKIIFVVS